MKRRLFIAINMPDDIRKRLAKKTADWQDFPIRWVRKENLHLTLAFLGYVNDEEIPNLIERLELALDQTCGFDLIFDEIVPAPDRDNPKMIWLVGPTNRELGILHEKIGRAVGFQVREHREFRPHITLGKVKRKLLKSDDRIIKTAGKFSVTFPVSSIELMSSELSENGSEYVVMESFNLE
jgi:RNA 2',3'-cyclic 3'-phosphodiesterase